MSRDRWGLSLTHVSGRSYQDGLTARDGHWYVTVVSSLFGKTSYEVEKDTRLLIHGESINLFDRQ